MLPPRVWGYTGGDNIRNAEYMTQHRGEGRESYLMGPSKFYTR